LATSTAFGAPGLILPIRRMRRSEAITDIIPEIGASQKTFGESFELIVNEINAVKDCNVINMVKKP